MYNFIKQVTLVVILFYSLSSYSQDSVDASEATSEASSNETSELDSEVKYKPNYNTWAVGAGFTMFSLQGDLRSSDTYSGDGYFNLGGYIYANKMFNPIVGIEVKLNLSQIGGETQKLYDSGGESVSSYYRILYAEDYRTDILEVEGSSFGFEASLMLNLDNLWKRHSKKWSFTSYLGVGYHYYDSRLIIKDYVYDPILGEDPLSIYSLNNVDRDGTIADYGINENRDIDSNAGSLYINTGLGVKYRLNDKLDIETRFTINLNNEDHLDAAIQNKQVYETFYTGNIGIVYKFGKKDKYAVWIQDEDIVQGAEPFVLVDTDDDGVEDDLDKEMNTPMGAEVYGSGIAIDTDKDGIKDYEDDCPLVPGLVERRGCPEPVVIIEPEPVVEFKEEEKKEIVQKISLLSKAIYFKTDSDQLKQESFQPLNEISNVMYEYPDSRFKIEGNTDDRGKDSYNLELSKRRAEIVYSYLNKKGVESKRLSSRGYGETNPIASNQTESGRQMNRRVEINFIDPDSEEGQSIYGQGVVITKANTIVGASYSAEGMVPAIDTDGDGVVDMYDKEPNTPKESKVYGDGVSVDSDMDYVPDYRDDCPFAKGPIEANGCPENTVSTNPTNPNAFVLPKINTKEEVKVARKDIAVVESELKQLASMMQFARSEGHILKPNNIMILKEMGKLLNDYESVSVLIEVHTSDKPNLSYNLDLSKRRAFAIRKQLTKGDGISESRLDIKGMGGMVPKYDNTNEESIKNNRVELTIN
jgi:outer membrane protein OmpA-like peptidoglycan-associated protein